MEQVSAELTELEREVSRRRTFAIISHPDAGKTTLTEKLLLYAGELNRAGVQQQLLGERRLAGVGVRDDRERPAPRHLAFELGELRRYLLHPYDSTGSS